MTAFAQAIRSAGVTLGALVELTKPRLTMLVVPTALTGYVAGVQGAPSPAVLFHLLAGTALVAGGANALNQILERDVDAKMRRTRGRPLPSGRVRLTESIRFSAVITSAGLVELLLGANLLTAFLGAVALAVYAFVYTPLKQITVHNTLVGAVVGAIPPLMGWAAARGTLGLGGWALAAILFVWQLPHFFAIAWIHRDDYRRGGFRMLSVADETGKVTGRQVGLLAMVLVPLSLLPAVLGLTGGFYLQAAFLLGAAFVASCLWITPRRLSVSARRSFVASIIYLPCLLVLYMADKL